MKIDISKIDKNFTVQSKIEQDNIMWLDAAKEPISMYGCLKSALSSEDGEKFVRIPREIAAQTNELVSRLYRYFLYALGSLAVTQKWFIGRVCL